MLFIASFVYVQFQKLNVCINSILFFICLKLIGYTNKKWISALKKYGSILFPILWSILNKLIAISKIIFVSKILFSFSYSKSGSMG
jgi:hypothetical protein